MPSQKLIASFDKGLSMLEMVVGAEQPLRLQDIANAMGMDKSSVLRFMATLHKHDLVERNGRDKTYSVGTKLAMWSRNLKAGNAIVEQVRPHLRRLTQMTRQTSHLASLRDDRVVLVEVMPSESAVSVRQTPGDWDPLYCSGVGKAILAFLPAVEQRRLIDRLDMRALTPTTMTSPEMLVIELRSIVRDRLAFDDCENNPQVSCIAAPILDRSGYPVASLGISLVAALHPGGIRQQKALATAVRQVADEVSREICAA
ncbi:MAG: IclR family transcriptional regulator [Burkholderiaceae bacterium]|nr:IclR family transcriptional regulator [Burkholderiaceae bacterium]